MAEVPKLRRRARRIVGDDADDVVQEVLLRALTKRHQFTEGTNLGGWANFILRNAAIDVHRHTARRGGQHFSIEAEPEHVPAIDCDPTWRLMLGEVDRALGTMRPEQRDALLTTVLEGEEAAPPGLAIKTFRTRAFRARQKLREALA